jgi:T5SS/PEP-CTERM-associated repeat protein
MRRILFVLAIFSLSTSAFAVPAFKGMSYTSFNNPADLTTAASDQSIANMKTLGVDTVALNVWWFQSDVHQNTMAPSIGSAMTATYVADVQHAIDTIHAQGMKVLLKPMLDVSDGTWRAYINPSQPDTWFGYDATNPFVNSGTAPLAGSYGAFIDTMANLAETNKDTVKMFSIGCELNNMENSANDQRWNNLISNVRTHYSGPLTYSANWSTAGASPKDPITVGGGYNTIHWWNQLDEIGIDAYFPVSNTSNPTEAQLQSNWVNQANSIQSWRSNNSLTNERVVFTETGYASYDGTSVTPYASASSQAVDEQEQADAYQAQLAAMSGYDWWDGSFWWNWETSPNSDTANSYSPQNKLVQDILASNYGGAVPALSVSNWTTTSASASFTTGISWTGGTPNQNFVAQFNRGAAATFTATLSTNPTVDQLRVGSNAVTFQSSSTTTSRTLTVDDWHTDTTQRAVIIGSAGGDVGVLNVVKNGASGGMTLTARAATIGDAGGAAGTLNINNTTFNVIGSDASNTELIIGRGGTGTLMVQNGGKVSVSGASGDATIGELAGGIGSATVTGAGSSWSTTGALRVGLAGQGSLTVASGGIVTASSIIVATTGTVHGDGTINGAVQNSGVVAPGISPGALHVSGSYTQSPAGQLQIELGGTTAGTQYDQLIVAGNLTLDGTLQASLINSFSPTVGNSFNIMSWTGSLSGAFATITLPALGSFLAWDQSQLYTAGSLSVISTLPGDYNGDGVVDAADYTVWRATVGQHVVAGTGADGDDNGLVDQADYDFWVLHFGEMVGSGAGASAATGVPEPSTCALALFALVAAVGFAARPHSRLKFNSAARDIRQQPSTL